MTLIETNGGGPGNALAAPPAVLGPALSPEEARALTDEAKADLEAFEEKCLRLYEGGAHMTLGYSSWHAYFGAEFARAKSSAYRMLEFARVVRVLPDSQNWERLNEAQAREFVPLLHDEKQLVEAYQLLMAEVAQHGGKPTAARARRAVVAVLEGVGGALAAALAAPRDNPAGEIAATILPADRGVQLTILDLDYLSDALRALVRDWLDAQPPDVQLEWTEANHIARARELEAEAEDSHRRAQDHRRAAEDARRAARAAGGSPEVPE